MSKKTYFLAGSPGAGKSEIAQTLSKAKNIDVIDTDEIRKYALIIVVKIQIYFKKQVVKVLVF
ncbi:zeta toxin family protein [Aliarcobacter butzleri]|uniref:zeta toxin family protein n=1 Tax=Aliarcobacter butzleri TaxID=28197 RepID=UPI0039BDDA22